MIEIKEINNLLTLDQAALKVYQRVVKGPYKGCVVIIDTTISGVFMLTVLGMGTAPIIEIKAAWELRDMWVRPLKASDSFTIELQMEQA
jgi:hypothetical protein